VDGFNVKFSGTNDYKDIKNSDVIIITAGVPRKPGMSRDDLLGINLKIMKQVAEGIKSNCPDAFVICITNPLDVMVMALQKYSNLPKNKVVGMAGILDSSRFKYFLGKELNIAFENIQTIVLGGHGDTMVPLLDYTTISGIPIKNFIDNKRISLEKINQIIERTRNGGGEVVSLLKDSSAFYSPACSAVEMLESYIFDQRKILPCSAYLQGEYGVSDLFVGVPVIIGRKGIEEIIELDLTDDIRKEFNKSVNSVDNLVKKCKKLLV
jgi:malate dehydrogenase